MPLQSFTRHSAESHLSPIAVKGALAAIKRLERHHNGAPKTLPPSTLRAALMYPDQNVRYAAFTAVLDDLDLNYTIDGKSYREASKYVFVGDSGDEIKVRFADHINQSKHHFKADFNSTAGSDAAVRALNHILDELTLEGILAEMIRHHK
jgi:hypothetical protein